MPCCSKRGCRDRIADLQPAGVTAFEHPDPPGFLEAAHAVGLTDSEAVAVQCQGVTECPARLRGRGGDDVAEAPDPVLATHVDVDLAGAIDPADLGERCRGDHAIAVDVDRPTELITGEIRGGYRHLSTLQPDGVDVVARPALQTARERSDAGDRCCQRPAGATEGSNARRGLTNRPIGTHGVARQHHIVDEGPGVAGQPRDGRAIRTVPDQRRFQRRHEPRWTDAITEFGAGQDVAGECDSALEEFDLATLRDRTAQPVAGRDV